MIKIGAAVLGCYCCWKGGQWLVEKISDYLSEGVKRVAEDVLPPVLGGVGGVGGLRTLQEVEQLVADKYRASFVLLKEDLVDAKVDNVQYAIALKSTDGKLSEALEQNKLLADGMSELLDRQNKLMVQLEAWSTSARTAADVQADLDRVSTERDVLKQERDAFASQLQTEMAAMKSGFAQLTRDFEDKLKTGLALQAVQYGTRILDLQGEVTRLQTVCEAQKNALRVLDVSTDSDAETPVLVEP